MPTKNPCLLYTSDAADDLPCVDLGGRRNITKKKYESDKPSHVYGYDYPSEWLKCSEKEGRDIA